MNNNDIKKIVNDELNKFVSNNLDKEMKTILHNKNTQTRDEMINTIKNSLESVIKTLWLKKDFWRDTVK